MRILIDGNTKNTILYRNQQGMSEKQKSIWAIYYRNTAYILLNTFILLAVINGILILAYYLHDRRNATKNGSNEMFPIAMYDTAAFEGLAYDTIKEINTDFNQLSATEFYYQPWVQYCEPLYKGRQLNVITDETGIPMRRNPSTTRSDVGARYKVFTFGGSTTFGYNVGDNQTYPYFLGEILNEKLGDKKLEGVEVVNYGRGYYSVSEETMLLLDLLKLGHRPSLVIFMDGLNLGQASDVPYCTETILNRIYAGEYLVKKKEGASIEKFFPIIRFARAVHKEWFPEKVQHINLWNNTNSADHVSYYLNRFSQSKELAKSICRLYNIPCLFFSQPVAPYNYDLKFYANPPDIDSTERQVWDKFFKKLLADNPDIIPLHHLFGQWNKKAIVDYTHYSPAFNQYVAQNVVQHINVDSLLAHPYQLDTTKATGLSRNIADEIYSLLNK